MAVIDSDAHVLETEPYLGLHVGVGAATSNRGSCRRPTIRARAASPGWSTAPISAKRATSAHDTSREAREMEDIKARLTHMDELDIDVQVLISDDFPAAVYAPAGGRTGGDAQLQPLADRYLESRRPSACAGWRCCRCCPWTKPWKKRASPRRTAPAAFLCAAWKATSDMQRCAFFSDLRGSRQARSADLRAFRHRQFRRA